MLMQRLSRRRYGFSLIELAMVLGVVGTLTAGIWRLMSASNQQTKAQSTAQQQQMLIDAVKNYLADTSSTGGQLWLSSFGANNVNWLPLPATNTSVANCQASLLGTYGWNGWASFCNYLPSGFTSGTTNPYGQQFRIKVMKDGTAAGTYPRTYSFMITTTGGLTIPDSDGGIISNLIGAEGGFIYKSTGICGATAPTACGTMGAWQEPNVVATYGFNAWEVTAGTVATRSYISPTSQSSYQWLARSIFPGDTANYTYNTMITDLFLGAKQGITALSAGGTTNPTNPALHLQTGYMDGTGNAAGPQISIVEGVGNYTAYRVSLVQLATGCSVLDTDAWGNLIYNTTTCPPGLNMTKGDLAVGGRIIGTKIFSSSDARLKTDIRPIDAPLDHLMKINPVAFHFKKAGGDGMGVIAQELEKIYPQLVSENNGMKYVDYNGLIGPLIGAVQDLKRENDALRDQLRAQSERLDRLERKP